MLFKTFIAIPSISQFLSIIQPKSTLIKQLRISLTWANILLFSELEGQHFKTLAQEEVVDIIFPPVS
jgi:hypothetical protein